MDEILQDERFVHVTHDPSFKRIPRRERKVKIDKRFQSMFHDNKFKVKYTVDKRGRPTNFTSQEDLKRFYEVDSDSQSEDISETEESEDEIKTKIKRRMHHREETDEAPDGIDVIFSNESSDGNNNDKNEEDDENSEAEDFEGSELVDKVGDKSISEKVKRRLQDLTVDYARGEGAILSDSSSDESSETEDLDEENDVDHRWGEMDQDAERTDQETERLAVCNMDWDRIHAQDLLVLLNSFLPKGGVIHSVTIYPSEYGMQRMKEEEEKGPIELTEETKTQELSGDEEDEEGDGTHYHREKLRRYQLNRLRYYYAIVVCDSVQTASALYAECDGMEYESSAARLDLRFVPEGTEFEQEPREVCTELPDMKKYEPRLFITTALQQSKVQLTWDETDPRRLEFTKKIMSGKADDIDDSDLKVYLASSSSEEEEEETEKGNESDSNGAAKYRALLQTIESAEKAKKDKDMEMEVTWGIGLKEKVDKRLKEGTPETKTPFEQYLVKRKEKLKAKRKERIKKKQEVAESDESNEAAFSDDDVPSDVDFNDPYFKEELEDKKTVPTKGHKQKKREKRKEEDDPESKQRKAELELLLMDEDDDRQHFNLKDILENESNKNKKKKRKLKVEEIKKKDGFQVNVKDERFSALYTSHLFNIDPADPHYRKTKGMEALRTEKLSRRQAVEEVPQVPSKIPKKERQKYSELSLLVKNVKMKTQHLTK